MQGSFDRSQSAPCFLRTQHLLDPPPCMIHSLACASTPRRSSDHGRSRLQNDAVSNHFDQRLNGGGWEEVPAWHDIQLKLGVRVDGPLLHTGGCHRAIRCSRKRSDGHRKRSLVLHSVQLVGCEIGPHRRRKEVQDFTILINDRRDTAIPGLKRFNKFRFRKRMNGIECGPRCGGRLAPTNRC
jgi:hypothetical protein